MLNYAEIKNCKTRTEYFPFKENSTLSDTTPCAVTTYGIGSLQTEACVSTLGPETHVPCRYTMNWPRAEQLRVFWPAGQIAN